MKIVIYANCQGIGISYFLKKSIDILSNNILSNPMRNSSDERNLAGFCRNCLSKWYREAAKIKGIEISDSDSRKHVYGISYEEWKGKYQKK